MKESRLIGSVQVVDILKTQGIGKKMVHHTQKSRKRNLDLIIGWIGGQPQEQLNLPKLERKIMLVLGASRVKAKEYIEVILGEEA